MTVSNMSIMQMKSSQSSHSPQRLRLPDRRITGQSLWRAFRECYWFISGSCNTGPPTVSLTPQQAHWGWNISTLLPPWNKNFYVRILFIDQTSALNTVMSYRDSPGLQLLSLSLTAVCQSWKYRKLTMNTDTPQGCSEYDVLLTIYTRLRHFTYGQHRLDVQGWHNNHQLDLWGGWNYVQEWDDKEWCGSSNISLNIVKTKEMILDMRSLHQLLMNCKSEASQPHLEAQHPTTDEDTLLSTVLPQKTKDVILQCYRWEHLDQLHHGVVR